MPISPSEQPEADRYRGDIGPEIAVISLPEFRRIERLYAEREVPTADGTITGRKADYEVRLPGGEHYPIRPSIFFGTYEIVGRVRSRFIAKRLFHVRRAWPITSSQLTFNYDDDRGSARVSGGWVYRSDDDDLGVINAAESERTHTVVGTLAELRANNWPRRLSVSTWVLNALPPVLILLALGALIASEIFHNKDLSKLLLLCEALAMAGGLALYLRTQSERWALKAAVCQQDEGVARLTPVLEALGERYSEQFPHMALWRAAQKEDIPDGPIQPAQIEATAAALHALHGSVQAEVDRTARITHWIHRGVQVGAAVILACTLFVLFISHLWWVEAFAIWLPSVVGVLHAFSSQKRFSHRCELCRSYLRELELVQAQILGIKRDPGASLADGSLQKQEFTDALKLLCIVAGRHSQERLRLALANTPGLPV